MNTNFMEARRSPEPRTELILKLKAMKLESSGAAKSLACAAESLRDEETYNRIWDIADNWMSQQGPASHG